MRPAKARLEALLASVPPNQTIPITVLQALGSWDQPWFDRDAIDRALRAIHAIGIWTSTRAGGTQALDMAEGDLENKIWYEDALNAYKAKGVINGKEFDAIIASVESATGILNDPGLRQRLYDQTFTMVREGNQAIIENVAAAMRKTISSQGTAADFLHDINDVYKTAGIADQQFWYSELVYNNAANRAYQEGLDAGAAQMAQDGTLWGYEWQHSGNPNPRPSHKALDGWAAPADDPRWAQIGTPPIGHNCACRRFPVTHWDARRRKLDPTPPTPVVTKGPGAGKDAIEVLDTVAGERFGKSDWNTLNRPLLNPSYDLPQSKYVGPAPDPAAAKSIPKPVTPKAPTIEPVQPGSPPGAPERIVPPGQAAPEIPGTSSGTISMDVRIIIEARERAIVREQTEQALVFSPDGTLRLHVAGDASKVHFTDQQAILLVGGIVTHNHPNGSGLSLSDVTASVRKNVMEMRAVSVQDGNEMLHAISPAHGKQWPELARFDDWVSRNWEETFDRFLLVAWAKAASGRKTGPVEIMAAEMAIMDLARQFDLEYRKERMR